MKIIKYSLLIATSVGLLLWGCSDDDPTGASQIDTEFQIGAARVETFTPVGVEVGVMQGGSPMMMQGGQMHVEHLGDDWTHTFEMAATGDGFAGEMMFFEPGEHELHFQGTRHMGGMMEEIGQHRLTVHRQHRVVGPYWVELAVEPAPALQNGTARVRFLVFELGNAAPGDPVGGLSARVTVHDPSGQGPTLPLTEAAAGSYETDHTFGDAGLYELHLEVDDGVTVETGDFHIPVLASSDDSGLDYRDHHGGRGHQGMGG